MTDQQKFILRVICAIAGSTSAALSGFWVDTTIMPDWARIVILVCSIIVATFGTLGLGISAARVGYVLKDTDSDGNPDEVVPVEEKKTP